MVRNLSVIRKELTDLKQEIRTLGTSIVSDAFRNFFARYPEVVEVRWRQYTPYFNDGDPCTFRANDFCILTQSALEEAENSWRASNGYYSDDYDLRDEFEESRWRQIHDDLRNIYLSLDFDNFLELALGNDRKVRVSRNGVDTDEYEHD